MALTDLINVSYLIETTDSFLPVGKKIKGRIFIRVNQNIGFELAQYALQYEIKGKLYVGKTTVTISDIDRDRIWTKNKEYEYDFLLEIIDEPISFAGKNLEVVWSIMLIVILDENTRSDLRAQFLRDVSFKKLFKSFDGRIKHKYPVRVINPLQTYTIKEFNKESGDNSHTFSVVGAFLILITALLYTQDIVGTLSYIALLIGLGALGYGLYRVFSIGMLGKIGLTGKLCDENEFYLNVRIQKNHQKITLLSIYYTVNEEVIDDRGTSSTTYRETIFTSPLVNLKKPTSNNFDIKLSYPKKDIPFALQHDKVRIYTRLHLEFEFSNHLLFTLKEEFPMIEKK